MKKRERKEVNINYLKLFRELIEKELKNKNGKLTWFNDSSIQNQTLRSVENESKTPRLQLRIKLESPSPARPFYDDITVSEVISNNAFDESLKEVRNGNKVIYAFADHDMKTDGIIASSNDKNVILKKEKNEIIFEFDIDLENKRAKTIYNLVEKGSINGNSFAFIASKISYKEIKKDGKLKEVRVIIEKGNLLSIDPVVYPFYPQNKMKLKSLFEIDKEIKNIEKEGQKTNMKDLLLKQLQTIYLTRKKEFKSDEFKDKKEEELFDLLEIEKREHFEEMIEKRFKKDEIKSLKESFEASAKQMRDAFNTQDQEERDKLKKQLSTLQLKIDKKSKIEPKVAIRNFLYGDYWLRKDNAETVKGIIQFNEEATERMDQTERDVYKLKASEIETRDIIGNDNDNAALVIPIFTDPKLIGEDLYQLPEIEGAQRISIIGEAEVKIPVNVSSDGKSVPIAIGAEATKYSPNAVITTMKPIINSEYHTYNPRMSAHVNMVPQVTIDLMNRQRSQWRSSFVQDLLTHIAVTFDSVKETYKGGASKEAIVESTSKGSGTAALVLADFDKMTDNLIAKYGDRAKTLFRFYMNSATWGIVKELARAQSNDVTVRIDLDGMRINGIKVITNDLFTQNVIADGTPIVLYKASNVRVYGGTTIIRDSDQVAFLSRNNTRMVTTYGQVKLCDPKYDTRVLKVVA